MLVEKYLYAVVSLPAGIFQPYSGVKTSILFMDKGLARKADSILFVKVENDGFDLGAQRKEVNKNDLPFSLDILKQYKQALLQKEDIRENVLKDQDDENIILVKKHTIAKGGDYNLSVSRYKPSNTNIKQKWPLIKLGDENYFQIESGGTPDSQNLEYWDGSICWVTLADLPADDFVTSITNTVRKITDKGLKNSSAKLLPQDTILVSSRATLGRVAISKVELATNQGFKNIIIKDLTNVNPIFVAYMLQNMSTEIETLATGGTFKEISKASFATLELPLPPVEMQNAIVFEIESYQKIIDGAKQVVDNYKPQFKIDPNWEKVELSKLAKLTSGGTPSRDKPEYWNGTIPWVKTGQINYQVINQAEEYITELGLENSSAKIMPKGSILMALYGQGITRGKVGILGMDAAINQACLAIIPTLEEIDQHYLFYYLMIQYDYLRSISDDRGGNQSNLNSQLIKQLLIPLPDKTIQREIAQKIQEEQYIINANKRLIEIFEQKIKDKIAEVWQAEEEISFAIPEEIKASEDVIEETSDKVEIRQAELFSLL